MLLIDRLRNKEGLTKTEAGIAECIINAGAGLQNYSARMLAETAYASPAAVQPYH